MEAPALALRGRPRARDPQPGEPERKRVCKQVETVPPSQADVGFLGWAMELDSKQKFPTACVPQAAKMNQESMVIENHGSRGTAQPCPRCMAGESGHFSHILDL